MPDPKLFLIFTAVIAIAVLFQAGILLGIALGARDIKKSLDEALSEFRQKGMPVFEHSRVILADAAPKIRSITDNLVDTTETLKRQATRVDGAVDDVLARTRHQVARVDAMVGTTLDAVTNASNAVHNTMNRASSTLHDVINAPTRHFSGMVNAVTAAANHLWNTAAPKSRTSTATRYRKAPVSTGDVTAAGKPVRADVSIREQETVGAEPLVPPAV